MRFFLHIWQLCLKLTQIIFPDRPNVIDPKKSRSQKFQNHFQAEIYFTERNDSCYLRISFSSGQFGGKRQLGEGSVGVAGDYPLDWSPPPVSRQRVRSQLQTFWQRCQLLSSTYICPFYICSWLFSVHRQCPFHLSTLGLQWNSKTLEVRTTFNVSMHFKQNWMIPEQHLKPFETYCDSLGAWCSYLIVWWESRIGPPPTLN